MIADLHLDPRGGPRVDDFVAWLDALQLPRLVILGDLFDSWIGPKQLRLPGSPPVLDALARLVQRGTELHVVPGNRDFLLGKDLEKHTQGKVHPRGLLIDGAAGRSLLIHGDELCTKDLGYQRYKRWIQSAPAKGFLPRLPLFVLRRIAQGLRAKSEQAVPAKPQAEKAMQAEAALAEAEIEQATTLLCGHAHQFQDRVLEAAHGKLRWLVLDGWGGRRDALLQAHQGWSACQHSSLGFA